MSVHAGTAVVDLALPGGIPVAILIPSIVDLLGGNADPDNQEARRYQLSRPGASALNTSTTLAQNGIPDGAVLVLTQSATPPPAPRYHDVAEAVSAALDATGRPLSGVEQRRAARLTGAVAAICCTGVGVLALIRNAFITNGIRDAGGAAVVATAAGLIALLGAGIAHRTHRDAINGLALSVIATAFAAAAGFLVVPGAPGIPNALLAATAAAATAVLARRVSGCGVVALTAVSCVAIVIAIAALAGMLTAAPLRAVGSVSALISVGLLGLATRMSILLARVIAPTAARTGVEHRRARRGLLGRQGHPGRQLAGRPARRILLFRRRRRRHHGARRRSAAVLHRFWCRHRRVAAVACSLR